MATSLKVAVIGAGAGGLITAHELQSSGHLVTIFEKSAQVGGLWVYNPQTESDPLSIDPSRKRVHSNVYSSLRTNLPRRAMGFSDHPFTQTYSDPRTFPGHEEVLEYLRDFARRFGLEELARLNREVVGVEQRSGEWVVEWRNGELRREEESFDAVVVCSGKHTQPWVAEFPGREKWPGKQLHCHNYRLSEPFQNQIVLIIGAGPSALDIYKELETVAKEVHISIRTASTFLDLANFGIVNQHSKIANADASGKVDFEDGSSIYPDIILHCTGYKYDFPFLKTKGIVTVDDNRVGPLYKHVFSPEIGTSLSFVGLTLTISSMPEMELQAKWISAVLSGKVHLPSKELMLADIEQHYRSMEENGIPKHHTHHHSFELGVSHLFDYMDWLAAQTGVPSLDEQLKNLCKQLLAVASTPEASRYKEWDFEGWLQSNSL